MDVQRSSNRRIGNRTRAQYLCTDARIESQYNQNYKTEFGAWIRASQKWHGSKTPCLTRSRWWHNYTSGSGNP
ncbi:Uncharacterized protein HZ326_14303 [Fusarium oxysporum f. sp. albedinis]|nr:Uncharacterized protein HZ326_14303 [Fusarium oxysporum f. sp. albedinis]